jgi:hypothetical protein
LGTGAEEFEERLGQFIAVFEQARKVVAKELKQGRMPAFAERALAQALCQILFEETGVVPTSKKGGSFDQLLRIALDHFSNGRPRKDVADLMRSALSEKPTLRYLLKLLNTEKWSPQEL